MGGHLSLAYGTTQLTTLPHSHPWGRLISTPVTRVSFIVMLRQGTGPALLNATAGEGQRQLSCDSPLSWGADGHQTTEARGAEDKTQGLEGFKHNRDQTLWETNTSGENRTLLRENKGYISHGERWVSRTTVHNWLKPSTFRRLILLYAPII